jgi:glutamate-1-semialdehyde 2,1-aminomutase
LFDHIWNRAAILGAPQAPRFGILAGPKMEIAVNSIEAIVERRYRSRTPGSEALMERALDVMPGGNSRDWTHHAPYPAVFHRGKGPYLWDIDGNRYVDAFYNGLSIIHGHRYEPLDQAIREAYARGAPWVGATDKQVEFAAALCRRLPSAERVWFTNSGTEAGMLAAKLARHVTGKPLILKSWGAYHGSYDDLEAGLAGYPLAPDRTMLADFGDSESFERTLAEHGHRIAGVFIEPVMLTEAIAPPPAGFLARVKAAAKKANAILIIDDCLMFRLAVGGSAEKFGVAPDITVLGKFIGGGVPMGVVAGSREVMQHLDPRKPGYMPQGGSFNGNLVACSAGIVGLEHLTKERIDLMDERIAILEAALVDHANKLGMAFSARRIGSVLGVYFSETPPIPPQPRRDMPQQRLFRLACVSHGVSPGPVGQFASATTMDEEATEMLIAGACAALEDVAKFVDQRETSEAAQ